MIEKTPFFAQIVEAISSHPSLVKASKKADILVFQQENGDIVIAWDGDRFAIDPPRWPYDQTQSTAYVLSGDHIFPVNMRNEPGYDHPEE